MVVTMTSTDAPSSSAPDPKPPASASTSPALPPLLPGLPLVGSLPAFRKAPHHMLHAACEQLGDVVRLRFGPITLVVLRDPDAIDRVLQKNRANWVKDGSPAYDSVRLLLGNGLVTAEGDTWLKHRRLMQPAFHRERLAGFAHTMQEESDHTAARFEAAATSGAKLDVAREMMLFTQRVVLRTILSVDVEDEQTSRRVADALDVALHFVERRTNSIARFPLGVPLPSHLAFKRARAFLEAEVNGIIEKKRRARAAGAASTPGARGDLLDMLMDAVDEDTGARLDDQELFDEAMTLFLAGHETTSNLLSWTFALLGDNPQVDEALAAELQALAPGPESAMRAPLLGRVISESLRTRPPVWTVDRVAVQDDTLAGFLIPKGTVALVSPWVMHRHPRYWPDPERFDPDRFLPENEDKRHKLAFIPFIAGQRKCIGDQFALMEARIALSTWLRRFRVIPDGMPEGEVAVTLRPKGGLPARINVRATPNGVASKS